MKTDYAREVTEAIVADMEKGVLPWEKSWSGSNAGGGLVLPMNATTGRAYRGINTLLLWVAGHKLGSSDLRFLTFKQAKDAGGSVMKGARGFKIYFYKPLEVADRDKPDETRKIPMLREFTVFHVSQVEGCDKLKGAGDRPDAKLPEDVAEFIAGLGADVSHGGDSAAFFPGLDKVIMPLPADFRSLDDYRATLYHELTHWTGAKKRLDREFGLRATKAYAREELVAELGGAFLCAEFGLPYQTQHAAYLTHWLDVLREDKRAIFQAAAKAQQAVDYMRGLIAGAAPVAMAA